MASFKRSSLIASGAVFCCRLTGLAREKVFALLFGLSGAMDAFNVAYRIPNTLRDLFAEGALSQSYTSVAAKVGEKDGMPAAWELTQKIVTQLISLMLAIITVGIMLSGTIMGLLYHGASKPEDMELATGLCSVMWPFIGFASLSALVMGALNIVGSFGLPMLASAAFNIVSILVGAAIGYFIDPSFGPKALYGFAIGVVIGGMAQLGVQLPKLRRAGFRWKLNWRWNDVFVKKIWVLMIPGVLAAGVTQLNVFVNSMFALHLENGSVAALNCAFRLWQLPVGLFGVATGMVVLPSVSRLLAQNAGKKIADHLAQAIRFVAFFAVPCAVLLGFWGGAVVSLIYQGGRFTASDSLLTGDVLSSYSLGLLGYAGIKILQPVFIALEKPLLPMIIALCALVVSVSLNYYFVYVLHGNAAWLALTTSAITTLNFLFYAFYLRRLLGSLSLHILLPGLARIAGAALPLALLCAALNRYWLYDFTSWSFLDRLVALAAVGTAAVALYLGACWLLRVPELRELRGKLAARSR